MNAWTITQARTQLSKLIEQARRAGAQTITRNGRPVAVVVPVAASKERPKREGTLVEFFAQSPLVGSGVQIERIKDQPRDLDL